MIRSILNLCILVCQLCAISMILLHFFSGFDWAIKVFDFMKRHKVIATIYIVCAAIGLFVALAHMCT